MSDPYEINAAICEALGLDMDGVTDITISFTAARWPEVVVRQMVFDGGKVATALARYELKSKEPRPT